MPAEQTAQETTADLTHVLRWFMLAMVLANIAGMMTPILLPIYLTELGADVTDVGLVFTLVPLWPCLGLQIFRRVGLRPDRSPDGQLPSAASAGSSA